MTADLSGRDPFHRAHDDINGEAKPSDEEGTNVAFKRAKLHCDWISTPCFLAARMIRSLIFLTSAAAYLAALSLWLI
jgi:hypothetical protein